MRTKEEAPEKIRTRALLAVGLTIFFGVFFYCTLDRDFFMGVTLGVCSIFMSFVLDFIDGKRLFLSGEKRESL